MQGLSSGDNGGNPVGQGPGLWAGDITSRMKTLIAANLVTRASSDLPSPLHTRRIVIVEPQVFSVHCFERLVCGADLLSRCLSCVLFVSLGFGEEDFAA